MTNVRIRSFAALQSGLVLLLLCGCATDRSLTADALPEPFSLSLRMWSTDGRASYYELKPDGTLRFAGGQAAWAKNATDVGVLTDPQRMAVWRLVHRYELLDAEGSWFDQGEHVTYMLDLRAGAARRSIQAADDRVPGLEAINDLLFEYQSQMRYGQVIRPIELEIERLQRERAK